jgi:hypothetical protein
VRAEGDLWLEARVSLECALSVLALGEIQKGVSSRDCTGRGVPILNPWTTVE